MGMARASGQVLRRWLSPAQCAQMEAVLALVETDEQAPTAVRDFEAALRKHALDSLVALDLEFIGEARKISDLGSGTGFPGIALAVALPEAEVALVESQRRKCEFLLRLCAAGGVENARVVCERAEGWSAGLGASDVVLARALAAQAVVLEYAAPLLHEGGRLVDWRGRRDPPAERTADRAAAMLGLRRVEVRAVSPFVEATDRHLHVFVKLEATPGRFPRRPGVALKRPLGG